MLINNLSQYKRHLFFLCFPTLSLSSVQAAEVSQIPFVVNPTDDIGNGNFKNSAEVTQVDGPGNFAAGQDNVIKSKKGSSSAVGNQNEVDGKDANAFGDGNTAKGEQAQAFGDNNRVNGSQSSSFGVNNNLGDVNASTPVYSSNIFGSGNNVAGSQTTAVGHENTITKANSVALGVKNIISADDSLAIGSNNNVSGNASVVIGNNILATNENTVSIGNKTAASGKDAIAIGSLSNTSANQGIAIGERAKAMHENSVALGALSETAEAVDTESATLGNFTYGNFAGKTSSGTVSVGVAGKSTRQIQNISAGRITKDSTDAINGSQLYATNQVLDNVAQSTKNILGGNMVVAANGTLSMTNIGDTGKDSIHEAIKSIKENNKNTQSTVTAGKNLELKTTSNADGTKNYHLSVANDLNVDSVTSNEYKVGNKTYINQYGINANNKKITNVADGEVSGTSKDAVNGSQLYRVKNEINKNVSAARTEVKEGKNIKVTQSMGENGQFVYEIETADDLSVNSVTAGNTVLSKTGLNNGGNKITRVAAGDISSTSTDGINGAQLYNVANSTVKAFGGATSFQNGQLVISNLGNTNKNTVHEALLASQEEVTAGKNIKVTKSTGANGQGVYNIATADDISVNGITSNEYKVGNKTYINGNGINANNQRITNVAAGVNDTDAVNVAQLRTMSNNNTNMVKKLESKVHRNDRYARAGIAGSAAIASAPQVRLNGKSMFAIGAATYRGESATALKLSTASDNGHWTISLSGSIDTRGNTIVGSGAGYEW